MKLTRFSYTTQLNNKEEGGTPTHYIEDFLSIEDEPLWISKDELEVSRLVNVLNAMQAGTDLAISNLFDQIVNTGHFKCTR